MFGEEITYYAPLAGAMEGEKMTELVKESVETGISNRLQPWQAIFALLSYALGTYGIENERALILYGMILATLGFTMLTNYKHKEAIKKVIAPWLVEQLLKTLSEYLEPTLPEPPVEKIPEPITEPDREEIKAELREAIEILEQELQKE